MHNEFGLTVKGESGMMPSHAEVLMASFLLVKTEGLWMEVIISYLILSYHLLQGLEQNCEICGHWLRCKDSHALYND